MTAYINPTQAKVFIQPGGAGNAWQLMPLETTLGASSGGGASYESDFAGRKYVGTRQTSNPERIDFQIMSRMLAISKLRALARNLCLFNTAILWGCPEQDFTKFTLGRVFIDGGITSRSDSDNQFNGMEQNDIKLLDQLDVTNAVDEEVRPLVHLDVSGSVIATDLNRVIALGNPQCAGACGVENSGELEFLAVGEPIAPATLPRILYTDDGGNTWTQQAMTGITNGNAVSVTVAGNRVIVGATGVTGGVYSAPLADVKLGTATFVLSNGISSGTVVNDVLAIDQLLVVAVGATGGLWLSRDGGFSFTAITSGTAQNLVRIASQDENLIWIAGDNNVLLRFSRLISVAAVNVPSGLAGTEEFNTVAVPQGRSGEVYIGASNGKIYRARNAYEATLVWEEILFDKPSGASNVYDIQFAGQMGATMWIVQTNNTSTRILVDYSGGAGGIWATAIGTFASPANSEFLSVAPASPNSAITVGLVNPTQGWIGRVQG